MHNVDKNVSQGLCRLEGGVSISASTSPSSQAAVISYPFNYICYEVIDYVVCIMFQKMFIYEMASSNCLFCPKNSQNPDRVI